MLKMKTYPISENSEESIDFRVTEDKFALVQQINHNLGITYKAIVLNLKELMSLYMAIQDAVIEK